MGIKRWNTTALTGGTTRALDAISVASLTDGDRAETLDSSNELYIHEFDASSTESESSPDYIQPDDFATAGVWVKQKSPLDTDQVAAGTIIAWTTTTAPTDFLECNGATISRTTYSDLFAEIADMYGVGDGSTTFEIPDLRGEFLRGWDHGATIDPDAATRTDRGDTTTGDNIGTKQAHAFEEHQHEIDKSDVDGTTNDLRQGGAWNGNSETDVVTDGNFTTETRPRNVNVMYCIKY